MARWSEKPTVIGVRSLLFHLASAVVLLGFLPLYPVALKTSVSFFWPVIRSFVHTQLWLLRVICGQRYQVIGTENLPDGPCILASRHEAMWETMVLPVLFDNPTVMLKQEILQYPIAGRLSRKLEYIGLDRGGSAEHARAAFEQARRQAAKGRSVLIFPNGTRNPQHRFRVQKGVAVLYRMLKLPCVPIALDSGDFWPYRSWHRRPGVITVRILPPIPNGLRAKEFLPQLTDDLALPA